MGAVHAKICYFQKNLSLHLLSILQIKNDSFMATTNENSSTRLDKWLWSARLFKTRAIAKQMIDGGKVFYNQQRTKSGKSVVIGDTIRIRQGFDEKEVEQTN